MKNYLITERQLKKIIEQFEDEDSNDDKDNANDEQTNDETVSSGYFDDIIKSPLDSSDPLQMFFNSLN